eukprot:gene17924-biopygen12926
MWGHDKTRGKSSVPRHKYRKMKEPPQTRPKLKQKWRRRRQTVTFGPIFWIFGGSANLGGGTGTGTVCARPAGEEGGGGGGGEVAGAGGEGRGDREGEDRALRPVRNGSGRFLQSQSCGTRAGCVRSRLFLFCGGGTRVVPAGRAGTPTELGGGKQSPSGAAPHQAPCVVVAAAAVMVVVHRYRVFGKRIFN